MTAKVIPFPVRPHPQDPGPTTGGTSAQPVIVLPSTAAIGWTVAAQSVHQVANLPKAA